MFKTRKDIVEYILKLENNFPINTWTYNGIHLWPNLKIRLFLELIHLVESSNDKVQGAISENRITISDSKGKSGVVDKVKSVIAFILWKKKLKEKEFLFVGSDAHRVNYNGMRFNRFFDPLIADYALESRNYLLEYGNKIESNITNKPNIFFLKDVFHSYLSYQSVKKKISKSEEDVFAMDSYDEFISELKKNSFLEKFANKYSKVNIQKIYSIAWNNYYQFYKLMLEKIKPSKIFILCYYDFTVMPLVAAANKLGISTVEMQHGPQSEMHLAYGNWQNIPKMGYDVMPRTYWCWDEQSKKNVDGWTSKNSLYKSYVGGNPWIDFWKNKKETYKKNQFILYSLQPNPLSIEQLFPPAVVQFIKTNSFVWFLRLHPRQFDQKNDIEAFLKLNYIYGLVNIDDATNDPLPLLLSNCLLHITHFSGSAIEANLFKKHNIFFNQIGVDYYPEFISKNEATYINPNDSGFEQKMLRLLSSLSVSQVKSDSLHTGDDYRKKFFFN